MEHCGQLAERGGIAQRQVLHMGEVVRQDQAGQILVFKLQAGKVEAVDAPPVPERNRREAPPGVDDRADRSLPLVWALRVEAGPLVQVAAQGIQTLLQVAQSLCGGEKGIVLSLIIFLPAFKRILDL
ncbi:hypothetical protein D3C79_670240 [compost metagenome]